MFAIDKFRMIERRRAAAAAKLAHANDNRHVERRSPATPGRTALVGHWRKNEQSGRLEWHWSLEPLSEELEAPLSPPGRCVQDTPAVSWTQRPGRMHGTVIQRTHSWMLFDRRPKRR